MVPTLARSCERLLEPSSALSAIRSASLGYAGLPWPTWRRFDPSSSPSASDQGSLLSSSVDPPQNPQQTETFWVTDRTRDCRRDVNLRLETTFFSKASYFVILVQF